LRGTAARAPAIRCARAPRDRAFRGAVAAQFALGRVADHLPAAAPGGPRAPRRRAVARARTTSGGEGHGGREGGAARAAQHGEAAGAATVAADGGAGIDG